MRVQYIFFLFLLFCTNIRISKFLICLQDVRKTIVLSLPPSNATLAAIIECTLDVSEPVRRAVYCVLATKFPLQSLR